jgi:hypothetical protein
MAEPKHPNGLDVVQAPTVLLSLIRVGTLANTEVIGSRCRPTVQRQSSGKFLGAAQTRGVDGKASWRKCDSWGGSWTSPVLQKSNCRRNTRSHLTRQSTRAHWRCLPRSEHRWSRKGRVGTRAPRTEGPAPRVRLAEKRHWAAAHNGSSYACVPACVRFSPWPFNRVISPLLLPVHY